MRIDATDWPTLQVQWKMIHQIAREPPLCVNDSQSSAVSGTVEPAVSVSNCSVHAFNLTWETGQSAWKARWEILRLDCRMASVQYLDLDFPYLGIDPSLLYLRILSTLGHIGEYTYHHAEVMKEIPSYLYALSPQPAVELSWLCLKV